MMRAAMRSLDDPPGLKYSTLTAMVALTPSVTWLSLMSGVLPMSSESELWIAMGLFLAWLVVGWFVRGFYVRRPRVNRAFKPWR